MGRITGSASIETLVRVGIEKENGLGPEAKMVVLHDFTPCVDDELEVKRGQVRHLEKDFDIGPFLQQLWLYSIHCYIKLAMSLHTKAILKNVNTGGVI